MKNRKYNVTVTYGTHGQRLRYASDCSHRDAKALQRTAIELGYYDARIVPQQEVRHDPNESN
jgi:hypothetical protein